MTTKDNIHSRKPLAGAMGLALALAPTPSSAAVWYQITDLQPLTRTTQGSSTTDTYAIAQSINDQGQIVGFSQTVGGNASDRNAVIWTGQQGNSTAIPQSLGRVSDVVPTRETTWNIKINNQGQVVGNSDIKDLQQAVFWDKGATTPTYLNISGNSKLTANGINDAGTVLLTDNSNHQAVDGKIDPANGNVTVTNTYAFVGSGNPESLGVAINNASQVVVTHQISETKSEGINLYSDDNLILSVTDTGANPGVNGLNDLGWVAGNDHVSDDNTGTPTIWFPNVNDGLVSLDDEGDAYALNNAGQVVGQRNENAAILWYPKSNNPADSWSVGINLDTIPNNIKPSGLVLTQAFDINSLGQIVGEANYTYIPPGQTNPITEVHGFVATPTGTLNWSPTSGTAWDNPANWDSGLGFTPNLLLGANISAPQSGSLDVTGPVSATTTNNLNIGGTGAGTAMLNLSGGALTVTQGVTLSPNGILTLAGGNLNLLVTPSLAVNGGTFDIASATAGASITSLSGTETGRVVLGAQTLTLSNANPADAFAGVISGTGGLTLSGGAETLSGANAYTGPTAISGEATLKLAGRGSITQSSGVADSGTFDITATTAGASIQSLSGIGTVDLGAQTLTLTQAAGSFAGVIRGTGGLTLAGGSETLTGGNTYSGPTTITGGTLTLGVSDALAKASSLVVTGGEFNIGANNNTLAGAQLQSGSITGTTGTLTSTSDYDLQAGTVSANLAGAVGMNKTTPGTVVLSGVNTYGGGTTLSAGTLQGNSASLQGNIANNAAVVFDQATNGTYGGILSGTGTLTKQGPGQLTLAGNNTYSGDTTITQGVLQVGNGGTAGSIAGNVVNHGVLAFNRSDTVQFAGTISGNGGLVQTGTGTLNLDNAVTLQSRVLVDGGTLAVNRSLSTAGQLIVGSTPGSGVLNLTSGSLVAGEIINRGTFNYSGGEVTAKLTNLGTTTISGTGTHVINGNVLNEGIFNVNETAVTYTGDFTNNGAYVSDPSTSQFNNLSVGPNGYVAGGAGDQFIVTGNFYNASTQNTQWNTSNANLVFSSPTPGQPAQHLMQLAGADKGASAAGAVNNFSWGSVTLSNGDRLALTDGNTTTGAALYTRRVILPGGIAEMGSITSNYNVYYDPSLPENQYLLGARHFGEGTGLLLPWSFVPFPDDIGRDKGLTPNQQNFAAALNEACSAPGSTSAILLARCAELQGLNVPQQKSAIASLTPDQVPGQAAIPIKFTATRMDGLSSRLASLRAGGGGTPPLSFNFNGIQIPLGNLAGILGANSRGGSAGADNGPFRDNPLGFFVQARFNFGDMAANNQWIRGFNFQSRNVTLGSDYRFSDQLVAGLAFNYTNTSSDYVQSSGNMNSDSYIGAFYGSYYLPKDFYVDWIANYGGSNYTFNRQFRYSGFSGQSNSKPNGNQYSFALSSGKEFNWQEWLIGPYVRLEYLNLNIDSYQENGGDGFAQTVNQQIKHSFVSDLGAQISRAISLPWGVITPAIRVEWEHQYLNDNQAIHMRLANAGPGLGNFVIYNGNPDRDYINLGGSVSAALPNAGAAFLRYESRLGQTYISEHIVEAGVRLTF